MGISSSRLNFEDSLLNGENADIKGSATQVEDEDIALRSPFLLIQTVRDGRGSRFVDDSENIQPRDNAGIFSSLETIYNFNV